jgi:predicted O-methyltransferase YrrM
MDNFRYNESMRELVYRFGSEIIAASPLMRIPRFANAFKKRVWGRKVDVHYNFDMLSASSEREYLFNIASNLNKGSNILEIGTYRGGFTLFLSKGAEISNSKVYSN